MKHPVVTAKPLDSVLHVREVMAKHRINQLPIVVGTRVVGMVSDRDVRDAFPSVFEPPHRRDSKAHVDPEDIRVESIMSEALLSVGPKDPIADAARIMRRERVGALPVIDGGRLVGIVTRSDLLDALVALEPETHVSGRNGREGPAGASA